MGQQAEIGQRSSSDEDEEMLGLFEEAATNWAESGQAIATAQPGPTHPQKTKKRPKQHTVGEVNFLTPNAGSDAKDQPQASLSPFSVLDCRKRSLEFACELLAWLSSNFILCRKGSRGQDSEISPAAEVS